MEVRHKKVSSAPADEDESLVGGPDWNDEHEITGPHIMFGCTFGPDGTLYSSSAPCTIQKTDSFFDVVVAAEHFRVPPDGLIQVFVNGSQLVYKAGASAGFNETGGQTVSYSFGVGIRSWSESLVETSPDVDDFDYVTLIVYAGI